MRSMSSAGDGSTCGSTCGSQMVEGSTHSPDLFCFDSTLHVSLPLLSFVILSFLVFSIHSLRCAGDIFKYSKDIETDDWPADTTGCVGVATRSEWPQRTAGSIHLVWPSVIRPKVTGNQHLEHAGYIRYGI